MPLLNRRISSGKARPSRRARRIVAARARTGLHHRPHARSIEFARGDASAASAFRNQPRRPGDLSRAGAIGRLFSHRPAPLWTGFTSLFALDRSAAHRVARAVWDRSDDARRPDGCVGWEARNRGASRKIASIGVGVRHWITMHGFALNVGGDLSPFGAITPCGIANVTMTSIERETGVNHPLKSIADRMAQLARKRINQLAVTGCSPQGLVILSRARNAALKGRGPAFKRRRTPQLQCTLTLDEDAPGALVRTLPRASAGSG